MRHDNQTQSVCDCLLASLYYCSVVAITPQWLLLLQIFADTQQIQNCILVQL